MRVKGEDISIDRKEVEKFLGYKESVPKIIEKKLEKELIESKSLIEGEYHIRRFTLDSIEEDGIIFGGEKIESSYVSNELRDSEYIYLLVYTIGERLDQRVKKYSDEASMSNAMILDKIGVVAMDGLAQHIKEEIKKEIGDKHISIELYPSNKDFDISSQKLIYDLVCKDCQNIKINSSNQFYPIKTVAAIYGIGHVKDHKSMCDRCDNKCSDMIRNR